MNTVWVCTLYVNEADQEEHYFSSHEKAKAFLKKKFGDRLKEDQSFLWRATGSRWNMYFNDNDCHEGYCKIRERKIDVD